MIGKTNTFDDVGESKVSFVKPVGVKTPGRVSKISKFTRPI